MKAPLSWRDRFACGTALVLLVGSTFISAQSGSPTESPQNAHRPLSMPDFAGKTLDGQRLTSDDLGRKVVLLQFWSPCGDDGYRDISLLRTLKKRYAKDLVVIGFVTCVPADRDIQRHKTDWRKIDWPQLLDGGFFAKLGVVQSPAYCVVGSDRLIRTCITGAQQPPPSRPYPSVFNDGTFSREPLIDDEYSPSATKRSVTNTWPSDNKGAQSSTLKKEVEKAMEDHQRRVPNSPIQSGTKHLK